VDARFDLISYDNLLWTVVDSATAKFPLDKTVSNSCLTKNNKNPSRITNFVYKTVLQGPLPHDWLYLENNKVGLERGTVESHLWNSEI